MWETVCMPLRVHRGKGINMNNRGISAVTDRMLYCIGHDLKTPLNAMMGYAVLLEQQCCDEERVKNYAARIRNSGAMLASMINEILDYSGALTGSASAEKFDLLWLAEEAAASVEPQIKLKNQDFQMVVEADGMQTSFIGDKSALMRILVNLLSNAVKYTPENGSIRLAVRAGGRIRFDVEDSGAGMSEEFLERVFEPFTREGEVQVPGTGLGMYIVKELVDSMGGEIEIKSRPGCGTAVSVEFCLEPA